MQRVEFRKSILAAWVFFIALAGPSAMAVEPDEVLDDPILEARAREISRNLRCVVCQSQSIDDSSAPLAKDMRIIVRERLIDGDSDQEVYDFLVSRYGDYVLLSPPVQGNTLVLWLSPLLIFLIAGLAGGVYLVRMKREDDAAPAGTEVFGGATADDSLPQDANS